MTEDNTGSVNQNSASADTSSQTTDTSTSASTPSQVASTPAEKLVPQSTVDKIVGSVKNEAYERAKREVEEDRVAAQAAAGSNQPAAPSLSKEEIRSIINEEAEKKANQKLAEQTAMEFVCKMESGSKKYADFDEVVTPLGIGNQEMAPIIQLSNSVDNTADVMYELGKNPHKIGSLLALAAATPGLAYKEMQKLSASIKQNTSSSTVKVDEPLSQVTPSLTGTDNGSKTVSDLRKEDWLRG